MQIAFKCPECESKLEIDSTAMGSRVDCPQCKKPIAVPHLKVGPGCTLKGFKIEALLGKGGMGEVYLAQQLSMERRVALKILPSQFTRDKENVDRFLKEVRMAARLEHPHVVPAYEAGEDGGVYFLAMAYVDGENLSERLERQGPMKQADALKIIRDVVVALTYAWDEHRIIHRDIKPANIMIDKRGRTQLTDLGLSKNVDEVGGMTMSGTIMGTPNYMSPEQAEGHAHMDFRADMYSLGATLYHMLTSKMPFAGSSLMEVLRKQLTESLPDPRQFNQSVTEFCVALMERMLAKKASDRYATWEELIADVDRVLAGGATLRGALNEGASVLIRTVLVKPSTGASDAEVTVRDQKPAQGPPAAQPAQGHGGMKQIRVGPRVPVPVAPPVAQPPAEKTPVAEAKPKWLLPAGIAAGVVALIAAIVIAFTLGHTSKSRETVAHPPPPMTLEPTRIGTQTPKPPTQQPAPVQTPVPVTSVKLPVQPTVSPPVKPPVEQPPRVLPPINVGNASAGDHKPGDTMSVDLGGGVKLEMVWISPGTFMMGSPETKDQHQVTLTKGFWMGKYEVTQEQWQQVMGNNPSKFKNVGTKAAVGKVSWSNCQTFLSNLTTRTTGSARFRLPTEAEWEYACRAGTTTRFYAGDNDSDLDRAGWSKVNSDGTTHPVGQKSPNAWGLYDMHGNVWEWCEDWNGTYPSVSVTDPIGPSSGSIRVLRGGSWGDAPVGCRSARRHGSVPTVAISIIGFRVVYVR